MSKYMMQVIFKESAPANGRLFKHSAIAIAAAKDFAAQLYALNCDNAKCVQVIDKQRNVIARFQVFQNAESIPQVETDGV